MLERDTTTRYNAFIPEVVAYQKSLEKETLEYNQCIEQAKRIASYNNYTLDTAVYIAGCVKPSGY